MMCHYFSFIRSLIHSFFLSFFLLTSWYVNLLFSHLLRFAQTGRSRAHAAAAAEHSAHGTAGLAVVVQQPAPRRRRRGAHQLRPGHKSRAARLQHARRHAQRQVSSTLPKIARPLYLSNYVRSRQHLGSYHFVRCFTRQLLGCFCFACLQVQSRGISVRQSDGASDERRVA